MDELIERIQPYVETAWAWAQTPAAWGQIAAIAVVLVLAGLFTRLLRPRLRSWLTPAEGDKGLRATARRQILRLMPLLWPLLAAALALLAESILTSIFGTAGIVGFLKRLFLFLAVRAYVRDVLKDPFLRAFGRFLVLPIALVYVVGLLPAASAALANVKVPLGNLSFSLLWAIKFGLFGGLIFWLGRWSNERSQSYLENQEELRPATRILAIKASEIAIFGAAFLILMNVMGVDLTTLAVLGGALGVGIGLGLQQIASNFISGIILLLEGQATVGDYVELDGGEQGTIVKMTMRSIILET
ncbi:MAG: mechanosensitive ion channel, partial [Rhodobacteraceae bacterium]